ncbi:MAG: FkbM family methyltransferase [bacterium]|nr:FkbM family methyltransferase [bacterium]
MLKRIAKKVFRLINPPFESIEDNTWDNMDVLAQKSAPLRVGQEKMDETLFVLHQIKNAQTIKTDENEALTRIFTGQKIYVDTRDISVAPHLMFEGTWEPGITGVFQKIVKESDTVLDIGANFGYFGFVAGAEVKDSGKVFFIEANPSLCAYIKKGVMLNGMNANSTVSNLAISNKEGEVKFNILKDSWGSSSLMDIETISKSDNVQYEVNSIVKVPATTVDQYCQDNGLRSVDVIKLDIEGFEPQAFEGMRQLIRNSPSLKMFLEFAPSRYNNPKKFFSELKQDFPYIYGINDHNGDVTNINNYDDFNQNAHNDWLMLLLSKSAIASL